MISTLLQNRKTTRNFLQEELPAEHIDTIFNSITKTPSKNCIYPYRAVALTETAHGIEMKHHLYRYCTVTEWQVTTDNLITQYYINDVVTPNIKYVQLLRQVLAPVVICFIGTFYKDINDKNTSKTLDDRDFFASRTQLEDGNIGLNELMSTGNYEPLIRVTRDISIAATSCLLTAESLGYNTAFVGNGGQHDNNLVNQVPHLNLQKSENLLLMVCIGKAAPVSDKRCIEVERNLIDASTTEIVFWESFRNEHTARWPLGGPFIRDLTQII